MCLSPSNGHSSTSAPSEISFAAGSGRGLSRCLTVNSDGDAHACCLARPDERAGPMRIAIIHENWGAGAARCAHDLRANLEHAHDVAYFPKAGAHSRESVLKDLAGFNPDVVNCHSF